MIISRYTRTPQREARGVCGELAVLDTSVMPFKIITKVDISNGNELWYFQRKFEKKYGVEVEEYD